MTKAALAKTKFFQLPKPTPNALDALRAAGLQLAKTSPALWAHNGAMTTTVEDLGIIVIAKPQTPRPRSMESMVEVVVNALQKLDAAPVLPAEEAGIFAAAGLIDDPASTLAADVRSQSELAASLAACWNVLEAAEAIGVSPGRVRQKLNDERSLFGVKIDGDWHIPRFQFESGPSSGRLRKRRGVRPIAGLDVVVPKIRPDAALPAVVRFFTVHQADLISDAGVPMTPLSWLASGLPPADVAKLAEDI